MNPRRLHLLVGICLALFALVDFFNRIYVPRHHEARPASSYVPATVPPPVPTARIREQLASWLPALRPVADGSVASTTDDWALVLLGVFRDRNQTFAVVQATPAGGGKARKISRVVEGETLYGYKVTRIDGRRIVLASADGDKELQLFKPGEGPLTGVGPAAGGRSAAANRPQVPSVPVEAQIPGAATSGTVPGVAGPAPVAAAATPSGKAGAKPAASLAGSAGAPAPGQHSSKGSKPKTVQAQELKPGQAFELPESMRGMRVIEAPVPSSGGTTAPPKDAAGTPPPRQKP